MLLVCSLTYCSNEKVNEIDSKNHEASHKPWKAIEGHGFFVFNGLDCTEALEIRDCLATVWAWRVVDGTVRVIHVCLKGVPFITCEPRVTVGALSLEGQWLPRLFVYLVTHNYIQ